MAGQTDRGFAPRPASAGDADAADQLPVAVSYQATGDELDDVGGLWMSSPNRQRRDATIRRMSQPGALVGAALMVGEL
jgi:hypothetical protein